MEAARGIEHQHIDRLKFRGMDRAAGNIDRRLARDDRQGSDTSLLAQHRKLFLRRRTIDVERGHQDLFALLFLEQFADLSGRGRFARALQADHHDYDRRRGGKIEIGSVRAQHLDQRVVDDLDDLLARGDRTQHLLAGRGIGHAVDEAAHHGERDIGFEQRDPHFAHRRAHVFLAQRAAAAQAVENASKPV